MGVSGVIWTACGWRLVLHRCILVLVEIGLQCSWNNSCMYTERCISSSLQNKSKIQVTPELSSAEMIQLISFRGQICTDVNIIHRSPPELHVRVHAPGYSAYYLSNRQQADGNPAPSPRPSLPPERPKLRGPMKLIQTWTDENGQRMNQLPFGKNVDSKESERLHIGADPPHPNMWHSRSNTHWNSHTHTLFPAWGEGTFIFFFLAGLCATGAKAKGEERTQEGTHSSSLHSGFSGKEIVLWCCLVSQTSCCSVCQRLTCQIKLSEDNWSMQRKNPRIRTCFLYF